MSDIEDLADTISLDAEPAERSGVSPKKIAAGRKLGRLQLKAAQAANAKAERYWVRKPTLPRLKFLEGSDE